MKLKFKNDNRSFSCEDNSWARRYKKAGNQHTDGQNNYNYLRLVLEIKAPNNKLLLGICFRGKTYHGETNITLTSQAL